MSETLYIQNMVCPRCIIVLKDILATENIAHGAISLGEVTINESLTPTQQATLSIRLKEVGFELLSDKKLVLISQIKSILITAISGDKAAIPVNYSQLLEDRLGLSYSYMSRTFSQQEGHTLSHYILLLKMAKAKELLATGKYPIAEIADHLGYTSISHFSAQFKKSTQLTPTQFKEQARLSPERLDKL